MKRKPYKMKDKMLTSETMRSMRETAFGKKSYFTVKDVLKRADEMRDDEAMLSAAEHKRLRKQARRVA